MQRHLFILSIFTLILRIGTAQNTSGKIIYTPEDFTIETGTVYDLLELIPQIEVADEGIINILGSGEAQVMIDNKIASPGGDYQSTLEQITIDVIKEIEIITTPSARHDAETSGGVVNIILAGDGLQGTSGLVAVRAETGEKASLSGGIKVIKGKWNFRFDVNAQQYKTKTKNNIYTENYSENDTIITRQLVVNTPLLYRLNTSFSVDYDLNDYQNLELIAILGGRQINIDTDIESISTDENYTYAYTNRRKDDGNTYNISLNYSIKLSKDKELERKLDVKTSYYFSRTVDYRNTQLVYDDITNKDFSHANAQIDYERESKNGGKLEAGLRSYLRNTAMDYNRDSISSDGLATPITEDNFHFDENIQAGYIQWLGNKGLLDISLGLRTEISFINTEQKIINETFTKQYEHFFPSVHLAYNLNKNHKLSLGYNRSIRRPRIQEMNPFINDVNPNNIQFGNPDLRPSVTDNFEIKYEGLHDFSKNEKESNQHNCHYPLITGRETIIFTWQPFHQKNMKELLKIVITT